MDGNACRFVGSWAPPGILRISQPPALFKQERNDLNLQMMT